jgi:uncharacterized protein YbcI
MAKIVGGVPPPFMGTRDNLTIYLLKGEYVIRTKSSLTAKRVKRDPAFAKTMKYAGWLKQGARIASRIYRQIPADERIHKQYRQLTGKAMSLLKEGFDTENVITMLEAVYLLQPVENSLCRDSEGRKYSDEYSSKCVKDRSKQTGESVSKCVKDRSKQTGTSVSKCGKEHTGEYGSNHLDYRNKQTDAYGSKCGSRNTDVCSDKYNGKCYSECNNECDGEYNSEYNCIRVKCNGSVQMRTNMHMKICCLTIILETGRSERCRWEPLALVV